MKSFKKVLAMFLALTMVMSIVCVTHADGAKYTETMTADGWIMVENEGGATLGYSPDSGVTIIEVDGYAFKDMNRNGTLDVYEDWRVDAETRAADLASQLSGEEIAPLLTHGGWMSFGTEIDGTDLDYVLAGGRAGVTRSAGSDGNTTMAVDWSNALQELCEEQPYAIPAVVSIDPNHVSHVIDQLAMSTTFDMDLAFKAGQQFAKNYRAVGITMLLGPQIDLIGTPVFARSSGTYSDDPALTRDLADAFISGLQSTFAEDGTDLGWGTDSVIAITKHVAGAGAGEGGRNDHNTEGKYCVFPNNNLEQHLIGVIDGALNLTRSSTGASAGIMTNYSVTYSADGLFGDNQAGAYNNYKLDLLEEAGWDGFVVTDWGVIEDGERVWGVEDMTVAERHAEAYKAGVNQIGGSSNVEAPAEAFALLCDELGEDEALALYRKLAAEFFVIEINCGIFENPYISYDYAIENIWSNETLAIGEEDHVKTIIMLKNEGNLIQEKAEGAEKQTIYIPAKFSPASEGSSMAPGAPAHIEPCIDVELASKYFNVITDAVGEPTGEPDSDGNPTYTENDIIRISAEELAACDFVFVYMTAPKQDGARGDDGLIYGGNIQYHGYTPTQAREVSIASDNGENWSWNGNPIGDDENIGDLYLLEEVSAMADEAGIPVVACLAANGAMVMSEVEPLADVIFYYFDGAAAEFLGGAWFNDNAIWQIVSGEAEPYALLPFDMPISMDAVDAQDEDTVHDFECYTDSEGNTYAFAFGLDWNGLIEDERTETYRVAPVEHLETIEFHFAN